MELIIQRPDAKDAPPWCGYFFDLVKQDNLFDALESSKVNTRQLIEKIPPSLEEYSYAEGKWTIKMVLSHIIDCERLYSFNALCYSRMHNREWVDIEREHYAANANTGARALKEIGEEFLAVREATTKLFSYMTDEMLDFRSSVSKFIYTPRSYGWMIAGHNIHHYNFIKDKYLHI